MCCLDENSYLKIVINSSKSNSASQVTAEITTLLVELEMQTIGINGPSRKIQKKKSDPM